jgi:hypothetical protein
MVPLKIAASLAIVLCKQTILLFRAVLVPQMYVNVGQITSVTTVRHVMQDSMANQKL